ncbi:hypothetical protein Bbelb_377190 [Branchiostoma belcheri]|nr:hypothetical protein Bbelb_377190 [Branchiostoma belcheri]
MADKMERVTTDGQLENDVITHCYPPERISATAHHVIAPRNQAPTGRVVRIEQFTFRVWTAIWTSSGQFVLRPEPVSNIKPRRTAPLPHDRDPHGFTEKPIQSNRRKNLPGLRKRAINLKEYRADFAFEESIIHEAVCEQWKSSSTCFNKISAQDLLSGQVRTEESRHHCN